MKRMIGAFSLVSFSCSAAFAELQDDLVSYWTFDAIDIAGSTVADVQGDNEGAFVGTPDLVEGIIGEALLFDGVTDFVEVPHPGDGSLDFGADIDFTISAWIRTSSTTQTTIVSKNDGGTNPRVLFKVDGSGQVFVTVSEPNAAQLDLRTVGLVNDGEWHHVVVVAQRASGTSVYIDGVLDSQGALTNGSNVTSTSKLSIGSSIRGGGTTRRFFNGSIDDVAIWKRALSADEVSQIHANGLEGVGLNGGASGPIVITSIERRVEVSPQVTLVWKSSEGVRYSIERSTDLEEWTGVSEVDAEGDSTSFTDTDGVGNLGMLFYRVRQL